MNELFKKFELPAFLQSRVRLTWLTQMPAPSNWEKPLESK